MSLIITSGEPAGIGPDIILKAAYSHVLDAVVIADKWMLSSRMKVLGLRLKLLEYEDSAPITPQKGVLYVLHTPISDTCIPSKPTPKNAEYILTQLRLATRLCLEQTFSGMVTLPICKATINEAGIPFSGHTEFLASLTDTPHVVMMLACQSMRVALVTTHLPLSEVPKAITKDRLKKTLDILILALEHRFAISSPRLWVSGLNPHAGEGGYLGREEIDIITPVLQGFDKEKVQGPFPADTMFSKENAKKVDAFLAMYHDQGLSVLKYASFGEAVNITLGLPMIRTSVDHGTAFDIAGTLKPHTSSFMMAYQIAKEMRP